MTEIIGRWLLQFYIHPKVGALITTVLLLSTAILMNGIAKKINREHIAYTHPPADRRFHFLPAPQPQLLRGEPWDISLPWLLS